MTKPLTFGSLFAGIGGFDLGLERAGMVCKWQVEIDPYCRKVLRKHWPQVRRCKDVKTFPPESGGPWEVDVICGGFPCQDISTAGKGAGIKEGTRSGLWSEYARIVCLLRPKYVVVENVAALLSRGMGRVLGDLVACGYDCEWDCVPAASVGAPHLRERIFIVAHSHGRTGMVADPDGAGQETLAQQRADAGRFGASDHAGPRGRVMSDPDRQLRRQKNHHGDRGARHGQGVPEGGRLDDWWAVEPDVGRVVNGVSGRVDRFGCRIASLGNAVVPQVAEFVGRCVSRHHQANGG